MRRNRGLRYVALLSLLLTGSAALGAASASAVVLRPGSPRATTPAAPTITSTGKHVYVSGVAKNYVGTPGQFTFSDPGSTVTGYYYGLSGGSPSVFVPADAAGNATVAITPYNPADLTLSVEAANGANRSAVSSFDIMTVLPAGNIATLAWWKLTAAHKPAAPDSTGHGHTAALSKDAAMTCTATAAPDGHKCSLSVTGGGGQALTAPATMPVAGNDGSFSVSAWTDLAKCQGSCVALAGDATHTYEFALKYQHSCQASGRTGPCWKFAMPVSDSSGATVLAAASAPGTARLNRWVQLSGVFNATHGTLTLYVNGRQAGQVSNFSPWAAPAPGQVRIGNLAPGGTAHDWSGRISNACLFYGVLQSADATLLFKGDSAHPHDGCAAMFAKYP
ncbi:MAG TPA: LamG-like jellyroll fold domain-containing protein [Streptosporangiaceae bacterium]